MQNALKTADEIFQAMKDCDFNRDPSALGEIGYAIHLVILHTKLPNWRLEYLVGALISAFNEIYGYVVGIPKNCEE